MGNPTEQAVRDFLSSWHEPISGDALGDLDAIAGCTLSADQLNIQLQLPFAAETQHPLLVARLTEDLRSRWPALSISISVQQRIRAAASSSQLPNLQGVRNLIAVASGKGGVGKSTVTANLALALAAEGARVGVLDADIYGPSQGMMFGVKPGTRPQVAEEKYFIPVESLGLQTMSMSYLIDENTPMVWRGPMVSSALQQLLMQTQWHDLDYLLIDMPPGTGDIQLTLSQRVPVSGAVVVTTPQDIALLDAQKGIEMFNKVDIPVLGVVENMSTHICSNCGHEEAIFGSGGGERIADRYQTQLLGQIPLSLTIRQQADAGRPTVVADPASEHAGRYREIARATSIALSRRVRTASAAPVIRFSDD